MSATEFPEVREALLQKKGMGRRVFPHFLRIGANAGAIANPGSDNYSSLLVPAGRTVTATYKVPSQGFLRLLHAHLTVWVKESGRYWQNENRSGYQRIKTSKYLKYLSSTIRQGSTSRVIVGENQHNPRNNDAPDGNVALLTGNKFPGHARISYLLGNNDFVTLTFTNNAPFDLYVGGCIAGYRIVA